MAVSVVSTPYGRPAAVALHARLATAKAGDPLRPVTVVVPTNYVGVSVRRLLASGLLGPVTASGAGVAGLTLLTVYRLAELLGAPRLAAAGRRPVTTPVLGALARRALRDRPGTFGPVAGHPATEEALVRAHRELGEVGDAALDRVARAGRRAADVVRLHRAVRAALATEWYEEADLMAAACEAVRAGARGVAEVGTVVLYLPQELSRPRARLLRELAERVPVHVVAGRTGDAEADADVERAVAALGATVPPLAVPVPAVDEVVSLSDPEDEVRTAVRRVVEAVRAGTPLERIALLSPTTEPYARLCHEHLAAAGVPYNGAAVRPLADRMAGRWLLDLLAVPERGWRRTDVLGLLAAAPVLDGRGRAVPVARWERVSRDAGVVRGLPDWRARLARFAADQRARAHVEERAEDPRPWLVERVRRDAGDAGNLAAFVGDLADGLAAGARQRTWRDLVAWTRRLLTRHLGTPAHREAWPEAERTAADRVDAALDRVAALDAVDGDPSFGGLRRTLELELDGDLARVGRFGEGVLVGRLSAVLGVDLDLVVLLGCAEGLLPSPVREDSLLPDDERRVTPELRPRSDRVAVEHRHLLAALAAARRRVLTAPRGDLRRSTERPESRWLASLPVARRTTVPSFAAGVAALSFPATAQEHALRTLGDRVAADHAASAGLTRAEDPVLARGLALVQARRSSAFTRFDGNLAGVAELLPRPTDPAQLVAPTRLEAWAVCPFAHLLEHVLRVGTVEEPEELLAIDPRESGDLVHGVLEAWVREALGSGGPAPAEAWSPERRRRLRELAEAACDDVAARGLAGHPRLWGRDRKRLLLDLDRFCTEDAARRRAHGVTPLAVEVAFGLVGAPPLTVSLPDGRTVRMRGVIDRIDQGPDGALLVTDYKTGRSAAYAGLAESEPVDGGRRLQLPVYGLAARAAYGDRPVTVEYWFTSTKGGWKPVGYPLTDAVLDRFREVLAGIVDGIEAGVFVARPPERSTGRPGHVACPACDPDGLGSRERRRAWERKRDDPRLAAYRRLAEPEPAPASGPGPGPAAGPGGALGPERRAAAVAR